MLFFRLCISKISKTIVDNAEDLDIVMSMYNLLEHSDNNSMASRSFWNYYRYEMNDVNEYGANYRVINKKTTTSKSFEYKTKTNNNKTNNNILNRSCCSSKLSEEFLDISWFNLINCEIKHDLTWLVDRTISQISRTDAVAANPANPARAVTKTNTPIFQITSTKLYVVTYAVTSSINDRIKFLENIK